MPPKYRRERRLSRGFGSRRLVEPRAAELADGADRARFPEAIGHALGNTAIDAQAFRELASVEWLRQRGGEQAAQICGRAERVRFVHFEQALVVDDVIVIAISAASPVAR